MAMAKLCIRKLKPLHLQATATFEAGHHMQQLTLVAQLQQPRTSSACQKMKNPDAAGCRSAPCGAAATGGS
jgi:hypothetical protein